MAAKATTMMSSDSLNPVAPLPSRRKRTLTLTLTGYQAAKLITADLQDDEFAFFCPGCLRVLSMCSCPIDER